MVFEWSPDQYGTLEDLFTEMLKDTQTRLLSGPTDDERAILERRLEVIQAFWAQYQSIELGSLVVDTENRDLGVARVQAVTFDPITGNRMCALSYGGTTGDPRLIPNVPLARLEHVE